MTRSSKTKSTRKLKKSALASFSEVSLALQGWHITNINSDAPDQYTISAEMNEPQYEACVHEPDCRTMLEPRRYGTITVHIRDLPMHGRFVDLRLKRQRYQCRNCKSVRATTTGGSDLGPDIHAKHRMTKRLVNYISDQAARETFTQIGYYTGLSDGTIGRVFCAQQSKFLQDATIDAPKILGIDDKFIYGKWYTVFVDLKERTLIDIYKGKTLKELSSFTKRFGNKLSDIDAVCQDMSPDYRVFSETYLPAATIVIDKFHVIANANTAVDKVCMNIKLSMTKEQKAEFSFRRKAFLVKHPIKKTKRLIEKWLASYPQLKNVYEAKESFFEFYQKNTLLEAEEFYSSWLLKLDDASKVHFHDLITCMSGHSRPYIFNYFNYNITSGYLEALNRQIKRVAASGINYNFETLRLKLLRLYGSERALPKKFQRLGRKGQGKDSTALGKSQRGKRESRKKSRVRVERLQPPLGTRQGELDIGIDESVIPAKA